MKHQFDALRSLRLWLGTEDYKKLDVVQLTKWLADCEEVIEGFKGIKREIKRRIREVS